MAGSRVNLTLFTGRFPTVVGPLAGAAVQRAAVIAKGRVEQNIQSDGLVASGQMRDGIVTEPGPQSDPMRPTQDVRSTAKHTMFQEAGTRAHGPVRAKAMRFKPKGSNVFVFAKWVRGVPARHFMRRAKDAVRVSDFL